MPYLECMKCNESVFDFFDKEDHWLHYNKPDNYHCWLCGNCAKEVLSKYIVYLKEQPK